MYMTYLVNIWGGEQLWFPLVPHLHEHTKSISLEVTMSLGKNSCMSITIQAISLASPWLGPAIASANNSEYLMRFLRISASRPLSSVSISATLAIIGSIFLLDFFQFYTSVTDSRPLNPLPLLFQSGCHIICSTKSLCLFMFIFPLFLFLVSFFFFFFATMFALP